MDYSTRLESVRAQALAGSNPASSAKSGMRSPPRWTSGQSPWGKSRLLRHIKHGCCVEIMYERFLEN